jgi:hypothetical protein
LEALCAGLCEKEKSRAQNRRLFQNDKSGNAREHGVALLFEVGAQVFWRDHCDARRKSHDLGRARTADCGERMALVIDDQSARRFVEARNVARVIGGADSGYELLHGSSFRGLDKASGEISRAFRTDCP